MGVTIEIEGYYQYGAIIDSKISVVFKYKENKKERVFTLTLTDKHQGFKEVFELHRILLLKLDTGTEIQNENESYKVLQILKGVDSLIKL